MARYPETMKKAQAEIDAVVGNARFDERSVDLQRRTEGSYGSDSTERAQTETDHHEAENS